MSELSNQPSKHSRQLTSSASFLTKVQATARCSNKREKGSKLPPAQETHNHENKFQPMNITATHRREFGSLSLSNFRRSREYFQHVRFFTVRRPSNTGKATATHDCPRCWKENKPVTRKTFHTTHNATMLNNLARRRRHNNQRVTDAKDLTNTHRTHCRNRMRTHTCTTRHADTEVENNMRAYNKTRNTWHI